MVLTDRGRCAVCASRRLRVGAKFVLVACVVLLVGCQNYSNVLDDGGENYARRTFALIFARWDTKRIESEESSDFARASPVASLENTMRVGRERFGPLLTYVEHRNVSREIWSIAGGATRYETYTFETRFRKGRALVKFEISNHAGLWKISHIYIAPE